MDGTKPFIIVVIESEAAALTETWNGAITRSRCGGPTGSYLVASLQQAASGWHHQEGRWVAFLHIPQASYRDRHQYRHSFRPISSLRRRSNIGSWLEVVFRIPSVAPASNDRLATPYRASLEHQVSSLVVDRFVPA